MGSGSVRTVVVPRPSVGGRGGARGRPEGPRGDGGQVHTRPYHTPRRSTRPVPRPVVKRPEKNSFPGRSVREDPAIVFGLCLGPSQLWSPEVDRRPRALGPRSALEASGETRVSRHDKNCGDPLQSVYHTRGGVSGHWRWGHKRESDPFVRRYSVSNLLASRGLFVEEEGVVP